ncbi:hypothetical protein QEZ40_000507 [Streptomyces katrae]|uniref:Uncharacterized protein n=1 Tax=Streptomyces katrae TaxID=68223 RepID=A0ABT7GRF3_9ACTN|nr:hypothetical protein [Streptomyces katrae]MDK9496165.1 hypothetical protein [Streptomyces katrae]
MAAVHFWTWNFLIPPVQPGASRTLYFGPWDDIDKTALSVTAYLDNGPLSHPSDAVTVEEFTTKPAYAPHGVPTHEHRFTVRLRNTGTNAWGDVNIALGQITR